MPLEELLIRKKTEIVGQWFDSVINSYAPDTASFYKQQKDAFANPVGNIARRALAGVFDEFLQDLDAKKTRTFLDPLIRIRAVQDFTPSQAIEFVYQFKAIIQTVLKKELKDPKQFREWIDLDARFDRLGMLAFDIYMECKEKIYDMKANVEKERIYKAFSRAGLVMDLPDEGPELLTP
jgi:RsbT co-antagonist protein rsbRD N-terminal domain